MGKTLVIVESPAKCKKIEEYLGSGYTCVASFGHFRELNGLKSISKDFKPTFQETDSKQKHISRLRTLINKHQDILIATDDDREGEGIAWHICDTFNLPVETTKRILFNEITKSALVAAVNSPTTVNRNLVNAQFGRQILDVIIGYKLSPVLWQHISRTKGLSAGRCQSPALRMIYENEKEVEQHSGDCLYTTVGYFTKYNIPFSLNKEYKSKEEIESFLTETVNWQHKLTCGAKKDTYKKPPEPFTTSRLQQVASNVLHISPKETMRVCQKLYEGGYITYMRTDSKHYSDEFLGKANEYIEGRWGQSYRGECNTHTILEGNGGKQQKVKSQEAHEAIRPTNISLLNLESKVEMREKRMYKLIWSNTVESCMASAKYSTYPASISAVSLSNQENTVNTDTWFKYTCEKCLFDGWQIVNKQQQTDDYFDYLTSLKTDINYNKIVSRETIKNLKSRYSEAKLVERLEKEGIGRPSTFSSIIDKIQERGYVKKQDIPGKEKKCCLFELVDNEITESTEMKTFKQEKQRLVMQSTGQLVIEFLLNHFPKFVDYDYTREMEEELDTVARGKTLYESVCDGCLKDLEEQIKEIKQEKRENGIQIDENHRYIIGKFGPVIAKGKKPNIEFIPVKKGIDLEKLERGEYTIEELIDEYGGGKGKYMGKYDGDEIYMKRGPYGNYITYLGKNIGFDDILSEIPLEKIKLVNLVDRIERQRANPKFGLLRECDKLDASSVKTSKQPGIVRELSEVASIRNGKYGHYIYYKTDKMNKPKFISIKKYEGDYMNDNREKVVEWIQRVFEI